MEFISGMVCMAFLTISLFFGRFWAKSRDRFFAFFAMAFLLLAAERLVTYLYEFNNESRGSVYLLRLCAFILIIIAIWDKNRKAEVP